MQYIYSNVLYFRRGVIGERLSELFRDMFAKSSKASIVASPNWLKIRIMTHNSRLTDTFIKEQGFSFCAGWKKFVEENNSESLDLVDY